MKKSKKITFSDGQKQPYLVAGIDAEQPANVPSLKRGKVVLMNTV